MARRQKKFITDFGKEMDVTDAASGEFQYSFPRYSVWGEDSRGKSNVIDTGNDLEALQKKHGPGLRVVSVTSILEEESNEF